MKKLKLKIGNWVEYIEQHSNQVVPYVQTGIIEEEFGENFNNPDAEFHYSVLSYNGYYDLIKEEDILRKLNINEISILLLEK